MKTPHRVASPRAGLNRAFETLRRNRFKGSSGSMPMMEFVVSAHAQVGLISGAAGQDSGVGSGDVAVGADHGGGAAIGKMSDRRFLAGRLGVDVDENKVRGRAQAVLGEFPLKAGQRDRPGGP